MASAVAAVGWLDGGLGELLRGRRRLDEVALQCFIDHAPGIAGLRRGGDSPEFDYVGAEHVGGGSG